VLTLARELGLDKAIYSRTTGMASGGMSRW